MLYYGILDPNTGVGSIKKRRGEIDFSLAGKNGCKMNTFRPSITIDRNPVDFKILDLVLREAKDEGLTFPVLVIDFADSVRLPNSYTINPVYENIVFKNLSVLIKRYPQIKYHELWNEPKGFLNDPKSYAKLLSFFYYVYNSVDLTKTIIISGEENFALEVLNYIPAEYRKKVLTFDIHNFGSALNGEYRDIERRKTAIDAGAIKLGYTLPLFYVATENSTWCHYAWDVYQTEEQQALDNIKRVVFCWSLGIDLVMAAMGLNEYFLTDQSGDPFAWGTYGFLYNGLPDDPEDRGKGVKKLTWYSTKLLMEKIAERIYLGKSGNCYRFSGDLHIIFGEEGNPQLYYSYPTKLTSALTAHNGEILSRIMPANSRFNLNHGVYYIERI